MRHSHLIQENSSSNDPSSINSNDVSRITSHQPHKIKKDKILVSGKAHKHIKKDKKSSKKGGTGGKDKQNNESLSVNNIMNQSALGV